MKECFIDVETTGLDPEKHGVIQVAGIIRPDHVDRVQIFDFRCKPFKNDLVNKEALALHNLKMEDLQTLEEPLKTYGALTNLFSTYVDKFNRGDKMLFIGYNAGFDYNFMRKFWEKAGDKYFGSFFWFPYIDVMTIAMLHLKEQRHTMKDFKLVTVARAFGLEVDETKLHEALYDISLTVFIYDKVAYNRS